MSAFSGCSTTSVEGAQGDASLTPVQAAEDRVSFGQQAMAMDLRRRNKQHVMETMGWEDPRAKSA